MRWSQTLIPTMKEVPEGAEVPSHVLDDDRDAVRSGIDEGMEVRVGHLRQRAVAE